MKAAAESVHPAGPAEHGPAEHGPAGHPTRGSHGTRRGYVTGFLLSVVLTAIPFWLVMGNVMGSSAETSIAIMALAVVQIVVHMIYFLHMNTTSEGGWTIMALIFTLTLVIITLSGSIWVMYHLNANMMPMSEHDLMHKMP